jgi:hypothetical protein
MKGRSHAICCAALFLLSPMGRDCMAQDLDLSVLIQETQRISQKPQEMTIVWWIPEEFWSATFRQNKSVTPAQAEEFLTVVRPYTVVAVCDGIVGTFGGVTYKSEEQIHAGIRLVDARGTSYVPRTGDQIDANMKNIQQMMKPILGNMLGPLGQNLHFVLFPATTEAGARIANATQKGRFQVKLGEKEFTWRLPLDALLPSKACPSCKEQCKGSWNFCPWCGAKLAQK